MSAARFPRSPRSAVTGALLAAVATVLVACASAGAGAPASSAATVAAATARGCPAPGAATGAAAGVAGGVAGGVARGATGNVVRDPTVALREICAMMARSAAAWNRGDLAAFMTDYMPGDETTYIGRRGILRGPAAIRTAYAPRFAPGGTRDSLSFENVEVDLLAPDVANTIAWYVLARGDSVIARGPTSLVMRRAGGRWRIVHDHSS